MAGGSQLGEQRQQRQQQCLCLLVLLLASLRFVALRPSCTLQTTTIVPCAVLLTWRPWYPRSRRAALT